MESVAKVIKFIENTDSPVHISFDVSALDPEICNSTGNWVAGGMEPEEVKSIIHHAIIEGKLVSMDVVEFNAKIGDDIKSLKAIKEIFGD